VNRGLKWGVGVAAVLVVGAIFLVWQPWVRPAAKPLRVGISPYQDIAMLVNYSPLGLDQKHAVQLELRTMAWEDILPALGSGADTIDVGFGSLTEFLTKYEKLNAGNDDPIEFFYPLYVYKGGGFVSFKPDFSALGRDKVTDLAAVRQFLSHEFGAQRQSIYEMVLFSLARRSGVDPKQLRVRDISLNDGLLAAVNGSLDATTAGSRTSQDSSADGVFGRHETERSRGSSGSGSSVYPT
jgi:ABC-type nitrate/sulfonate/bicarbonate transport system substrate-binding protein